MDLVVRYHTVKEVNRGRNRMIINRVNPNEIIDNH